MVQKQQELTESLKALNLPAITSANKAEKKRHVYYDLSQERRRTVFDEEGIRAKPKFEDRTRFSQVLVRQCLKDLIRKQKGSTAHNVPTWGCIQPTNKQGNPFGRASMPSKERENQRVWTLPSDYAETRAFGESLMPAPRRDDRVRKEILWSQEY